MMIYHHLTVILYFYFISFVELIGNIFLVIDDLPPPDDSLPPPDDDLPPPDDIMDEPPPPDNDDEPPPPSRPVSSSPRLMDNDLPPSSPSFDDIPNAPPPGTPPPSLTRKQSSPKASSPRNSSISPRNSTSAPPSPPHVRLPSDPPAPTPAPLPPKPAAKSRRKSLLDIKSDKKALLAAATENVKLFNQKLDLDEDERVSEDFGESESIRDRIHSVSKPFSKVDVIHENEENEDDDDGIPAQLYVPPPRRMSIRMMEQPSQPSENSEDAWKRRSSVIRRQSISHGATPLSAAELKRGARLSNFQPFAGEISSFLLI